MNEFQLLHLIVPPEVARKLDERFSLAHKDGQQGYFTITTNEEFWSIVRSLVKGGYRVDITPGQTCRIMARKEIHG